jgi:hypothetical protein
MIRRSSLMVGSVSGGVLARLRPLVHAVDDLAAFLVLAPDLRYIGAPHAKVLQ